MFHQEIYQGVGQLLKLRDDVGRYRLLDLGCGNARYLAPCLQQFPPALYEGVDLSEAALAEARGYLAGLPDPVVTLTQGDLLEAVAAGDLEQSVGLTQTDEIGELASAFDVMTLKLRVRTAEAARLYAETAQRNKELAQANAKLQAAQQQLVQSEKLAAIGQLTAGIVHDVKNPLAVVIGMADELRDDLHLDVQTRQHLSTIRDNAWRANTIITDLLKFARQSTPETKLQDLGATVTTALRLTDYLARKGGVTVVKDIPPTPVLVNYDATQIEQVIINLIQNAIQAMPKGGHLRVNLSQAKDAVAIAVQDTGVGIPLKTTTFVASALGGALA